MQANKRPAQRQRVQQDDIFQEKMMQLTAGSNWIVARSGKMVTVLTVTNVGAPANVQALYPTTVVFVGESRKRSVSVALDVFLENHEFYNGDLRIETLMEAVFDGRSIEEIEAAQAEEEGEEVIEDAIDAPIEVSDEEDEYIDAVFMSTGHAQHDPLLTNDDLNQLLVSVEENLHMDGGTPVGVEYILTFDCPESSIPELLQAAFSNSEQDYNFYNGFSVGGLTDNDLYFHAITKQVTRKGVFCRVHLTDYDQVAQDFQSEEDAEELDDRVRAVVGEIVEDADTGEVVEAEVQVVEEPAPVKLKSFDSLAEKMRQNREAAAAQQVVAAPQAPAAPVVQPTVSVAVQPQHVNAPGVTPTSMVTPQA